MNREQAIKECEICQGRQKGDCSDQCRFWMITATRAERRAVVAKRLYEGLSKKEQDNARHAPMLGWHGPRKEEQVLNFSSAKQSLELTTVKAQTAAVVARFDAAKEGLSQALVALGDKETAIKVAEVLSVQNLIGGNNFLEVVKQIIPGLEDTLSKVVGHNNRLPVPDGSRR